MTTEQRPRSVTPSTTPVARSATAGVHSPYGLDQNEMNVLFLLREGLFVPQISERLVLPQTVVEEHICSLLSKMKARSKTEAAVIAIRERIFGR